MKKYLTIICSLGFFLANSQIAIGGASVSSSHTQLELRNSGQKVLIFPVAENETILPKYNASQPDKYDDDASMEAMLMYNKAESITRVYDGTKWENAFNTKNSSTTWTRASINSTNMTCLSTSDLFGQLLQLCSSDNLKFSVPGNSSQFSDYLSVVRNSETFRIRQKGLYRINFNVLFSGFTAGFDFNGARITIVVVVNGVEKAYMSGKASPFINVGTYLASADGVLFLDVNNDITFRLVLDGSSWSISSYNFGGTPESSVSVERIL
ncbi:hypothetical protein SAMN05421841_1948 [Chryseobacterium wanjuense]|uniref:C1q domain-containing protein n=1 Tax=Chryseobacterium wanjuense TaxID=356305 RepID=A0A1I0QIT3_9FLAO|nr:hypothetical protein [Chryseobacterium wanjuense]SEW27102.1 hypothetical protein SAMN05421841_1948 [Chryseobacterium wanjuense]